MKKCVYCSRELDVGMALDICESCGVKVWGVKMFEVIQDNAKTALENGDFHQGSVSEEDGIIGSV